LAVEQSAYVDEVVFVYGDRDYFELLKAGYPACSVKSATDNAVALR